MWQADLLTVRLPACSACLGGALFGCANHSWLQEAFYHPERDLVGIVHGDDLVFVGVDKELDFVLSVFKEPQSDFRLETTNEKHASGQTRNGEIGGRTGSGKRQVTQPSHPHDYITDVGD